MVLGRSEGDLTFGTKENVARKAAEGGEVNAKLGWLRVSGGGGGGCAWVTAARRRWATSDSSGVQKDFFFLALAKVERVRFFNRVLISFLPARTDEIFCRYHLSVSEGGVELFGRKSRRRDFFIQ